jgi:hypothetical protein
MKNHVFRFVSVLYYLVFIFSYLYCHVSNLNVNNLLYS